MPPADVLVAVNNIATRHSFKSATWFLGRPGSVYIERYARRSADTPATRPQSPAR